MRKILLSLILLSTVMSVKAQNFGKYFTDRTLRIDYIFSGNAKEQHISVDELSTSPRWYGKKHRLTELPMEGNGQIIVREHKSQKVIYRNSFSTLFQEWLTYPEAEKNTQAFENVFLVPMPKDTVDVTLDLYNNRREITSTLTHQVVPTDILIRKIGESYVTPHTTMLAPADSNKCIRLAYVAEGYKKEEMPKFLEDVKRCMGYLFEYEPFKSMKDRFMITAVESPSFDSETSIPHEGIWKNTALKSNFDTFYSNRYLTTLHLKKLHDVLAGIPYEHIIILVNTEKYGGGGILNSYLLSPADNKYTPQVVVHEFGHSFGGLGDEYAYDFEPIPAYPHDVEPWEANLTTLVNFHDKWEDMLDANTKVPTEVTTKSKKKVGVFEGAGYSLKGVYRPSYDCRMRTNENPVFCPVCSRALRRIIDFYTSF